MIDLHFLTLIGWALGSFITLNCERGTRAVLHSIFFCQSNKLLSFMQFIVFIRLKAHGTVFFLCVFYFTVWVSSVQLKIESNTRWNIVISLNYIWMLMFVHFSIQVVVAKLNVKIKNVKSIHSPVGFNRSDFWMESVDFFF